MAAGGASSGVEPRGVIQIFRPFFFGAGVLKSWRGGFGRLVVKHPWSAPGAGCCCRLPWRGTVLRFAGGVSAPNDRRLGGAVGSFRLARRAGGAVPG